MFVILSQVLSEILTGMKAVDEGRQPALLVRRHKWMHIDTILVK